MNDELPRAEITIWKGGEQVAHAAHCGPIVLGMSSNWPKVSRLSCYYFSVVNLEPPVVFEHLAGRALKHYFDHCAVKFNEEIVDDLRFVHGRSEVMKGRHKVGAVLLAQVEAEEPLDEPTWISYLPAIYREFLDKYQAETKTA